MSVDECDEEEAKSIKETKNLMEKDDVKCDLAVRSSLTERHLTEKWVGFLTERRLTELQFQKSCWMQAIDKSVKQYLVHL